MKKIFVIFLTIIISSCQFAAMSGVKIIQDSKEQDKKEQIRKEKAEKQKQEFLKAQSKTQEEENSKIEQ